jgi:hypothetical protein
LTGDEGIDADRRAQAGQDVTTDGEPEAKPRGFCRLKRFEKTRAYFCGDARPIVGHGELDATSHVTGGDADPAWPFLVFLGLDGVEAKVEDHLLGGVAVDEDDIRGSEEIGEQFDALVLGEEVPR